jgi:hypothetical protein
MRGTRGAEAKCPVAPLNAKSKDLQHDFLNVARFGTGANSIGEIKLEIIGKKTQQLHTFTHINSVSAVTQQGPLRHFEHFLLLHLPPPNQPRSIATVNLCIFADVTQCLSVV